MILSDRAERIGVGSNNVGYNLLKKNITEAQPNITATSLRLDDTSAYLRTTIDNMSQTLTDKFAGNVSSLKSPDDTA